MGLTKQYLRYAPAALFGLVGSAKGNAAFVTLRGERGRCVAVPACEHVFVWDARKGEKVSGCGADGTALRILKVLVWEFSARAECIPLVCLSRVCSV